MNISKIEKKPRILGGKPVIAGTRIPIDLILRYVANDFPIEDIKRDIPDLSDDEIKAALDHLEDNIRRERVKLEPTTC